MNFVRVNFSIPKDVQARMVLYGNGHWSKVVARALVEWMDREDGFAAKTLSLEERVARIEKVLRINRPRRKKAPRAQAS